MTCFRCDLGTASAWRFSLCRGSQLQHESFPVECSSVTSTRRFMTSPHACHHHVHYMYHHVPKIPRTTVHGVTACIASSLAWPTTTGYNSYMYMFLWILFCLSGHSLLTVLYCLLCDHLVLFRICLKLCMSCYLIMQDARRGYYMYSRVVKLDVIK